LSCFKRVIIENVDVTELFYIK